MMPIVSFFNDRRVIVSQDKLLLSCQLSCAALWVHAKRSSQPQPPFPQCISMQPQLLPLHLQRFLRGFVLATAHRLVIPPASLLRLVHASTKSRWIDRIFVRVMSGFVWKAEVRRQCSHVACACACCAALAHLCKCSHGLTIILLTQSTANTCGVPGITNSDAQTSASLPNAVLLHFHALLVCRLLPPPASATASAFMQRQREATSLSC
jgi:hypothetical protein